MNIGFFESQQIEIADKNVKVTEQVSDMKIFINYVNNDGII